MPVIFDLDGDNIICLLYRLKQDLSSRTSKKHGSDTDLEATMYKRFVEIENETFPSSVMGRDWGQQRSWNAILK
jgi:hypothetical protein